MLWLTLKTMPSAYYQESDFYSNSQRINTPGGFLFPRALKQRQSAESGPFISIYICIWKHSHMRRRGIIAHLNQCFSPYRPPAPSGTEESPAAQPKTFERNFNTGRRPRAPSGRSREPANPTGEEIRTPKVAKPLL